MRRLHPSVVRMLIAAMSFAPTAPEALAARISSNPEKETLEISKQLHSVPDEEWQEIAGERLSEQYEIVKGDTLFDISKRLFGDPRYWPKIWALNNDSITNPHLILPGNSIVFMPGTGTSLPTVAVKQFADYSPTQAEAQAQAQERAPRRGPLISASGRSQEWRYLPRQPWEYTPPQLPPTVDAQGFDKRNRIRFKTDLTFHLPVRIASEKIDAVGRIEGSSSFHEFLSPGDVITLEAYGELQVGDELAITRDPVSLSASHSDRSAYSYPILGRLKITSVRDGTFLGVIESTHDLVKRGALLIGMPDRVSVPAPTAAPSTIEGTLTIDTSLNPIFTSQQRFAFVDRGIQDGIRPGMVFRAYQYKDPTKERHIVDADLLPLADFMVYQSIDSYSIVLVLNGYDIFEPGTKLTALTTISDLVRRESARMIRVGESGDDNELTDLEQLDRSEGMGKEEEQELKELERYGKPAGAPKEGTRTPPTAPTETPTPTATPSPTATQTPTPAITPEPTAPPPPPADDSSMKSTPELDDALGGPATAPIGGGASGGPSESDALDQMLSN